MVYGIISNLDNVNTLEVFKSKRIEEEYLVHINYLGKLIEVLKEGDTVYMMSVNRILTVAQCLAFGKVCMARGVSFSPKCLSDVSFQIGSLLFSILVGGCGSLSGFTTGFEDIIEEIPGIMSDSYLTFG